MISKIFKFVAMIIVFTLSFISSIAILFKYQPDLVMSNSKPIIEYFINSEHFKFQISSIEHNPASSNFCFKNVRINYYDNLGLHQNAGEIKQIDLYYNIARLIKNWKHPINLKISDLKLSLPDIYNSEFIDVERLQNKAMMHLSNLLRPKILWVMELELTNANIDVIIGKLDENFAIQKAVFTNNIKKSSIQGALYYYIKGISHHINFNAEYRDGGYIDFYTSFKKLPIHLLTNHLDDLNIINIAKNSILNLNGEIFLIYNIKKKTSDIKIDLDEIFGYLVSELDSSVYLDLEDANIHIESIANAKLIKLNKFDIFFDHGAHFKLNGVCSIIKKRPESVEIEIDLKNIPNYISQFLPKSRIGTSKYFKESLLSGKLDGANLKMSYQYDPKNKDNIFDIKGLTVGNALISGIEFRYAQDKPLLKIAKLNLFANGPVISFESQDGHISNAKIESLNLAIDLFKKYLPIKLEANISGKISDIVKLIDNDKINELATKKIDLRSISANIQSKILVEANYEDQNNENKYNISAKISNASWSILDDLVNISHGNLDAKFNGKAINFSGSLFVNDRKAEGDYVLNIDDEAEFDNIINGKILLEPLSKKPNYKTLDSKVQIKSGSASLDFQLKSKDSVGFYKIDGDLSKAEFEVSEIGLKKEINEKANLSIYSKMGKEIDNVEISLKGHKIEIKGNGKLSSGLTSWSIPKISYNNSVFNLEYEDSNQLERIKIKGGLLDLSKFNFAEYFKERSKAQSKANKKTDIDVKFKNVVMKNNIKMRNTNISINCHKSKCSKIDINASYESEDDNEEEYVTIEMLSSTEASQKFQIYSNRADKLLKSLDLYQNIKKGEVDLIVNSATNKDTNKTSFDGSLHMKNFSTVQNAFLTNIASFLSIPGLLRMVSQNDISFSNFDINFKYGDNILYLDHGNVEGPYLDFTISKGKVNIETKKYHMNGSVVPSLYGLNMVAKNLPIISQLFSKGPRKGLIIAPYAISGDY